MDQTWSEEAELFYEPLISTYLDGAGTVTRDWLHDEVNQRLALPSCQFVLLVGEPGAGKTGFMASLARRQPDWLRYFIRLDSTKPLSGGDSTSLMLRLGHQLAHRRPDIFDPELLQIEVTQRVQQAGPTAKVIAVKIEDLQVSPFYRTSIRVQQNVVGLAGGLTGVEIGRATIEPRLLNIDTLSHLALLDPALVFARKYPNETIVVLIDALDEVFGKAGGATILDWLETVGPPPNVRFVLSSQPSDRLQVLKSVRGDALEMIELDAESPQLKADVRKFARTLFDETQVLAKFPDPSPAIESLVDAAQGNFAYLTAYARALRAAVADKDEDQLKELLAFESLPSGLLQLYAVFARRMRRQIETLGQLEIESPRDQNDELTPAWEGVGQRLLSVLAVAFGPLSLKQLMALGSIRVWESAAKNVLQTIRPFLDQTDSGWRFFHPSLASFLRSAEEYDAADVAVNAREWHTRILRYYRGTQSWSTVDWRKVDSYGLLHVADHIAATQDDPAAAIEVITSSFRAASNERFLSDLPFQRLVQTVRDRVTTAGTVADVLTNGLFLKLVLSGLGSSAGALAPAVYGLMARLGRVEEALARADVLEPGLRKYRTFEAICASTPAELRDKLGPLDGVERLVGVAVEVPLTAGPMVGALGYDLSTCLREAAVAMVPHDMKRALQLAELADKDDPVDKAMDAVQAAAAVFNPDNALDALSQMESDQLRPAVDAAERATPGPVRDQLIAFAIAHLEEADYFSQPLLQTARLIVLFGNTNQSGQKAVLRSKLEEAITANSTAREEEEEPVGLVGAAETLHDTDPDLAERLLKSYDSRKVDSLVADTLVDAAKLWVAWGQADEARVQLNRALEAYRALGWYGPSRDIAEVARVAASFDLKWSEELADEAMALIEGAIRNADEGEWIRLGSILSGVVENFRHVDLERALKVARWSSGDWIHGSPWRSTEGLGGLAIIGLDVAPTDRKLAEQLLSECLTKAEREVRLGRPDANVARWGLFKPADEATAPPSRMQASSTLTSIMNYVSYWRSGRTWRFFKRPADVFRSISAPFPSTASWARTVAAAVQPTAAIDLDRAFALLSWPADPCERLIALAAFAGVCDENNPRRPAVLAALASTLVELPNYQPEIDLSAIPERALLAYLSPSLRARFEAALLLPSQINMLPENDDDTWYLHMAFSADGLFHRLMRDEFSNQKAEELDQQMNGVSDHYGQADPLIKDLLETAAIYTLAPMDPTLAEKRIERIENPAVKMFAKVAHRAGSVDASLAVDTLQLLESAGEDVSPLHRAELAEAAISICRSANQSYDKILEWGLAQLESADPLMITRGLTTLAPLAPEEQQADLLSRALTASDGIGNQYMRWDAVSDLLGAIVQLGDGALVTKCLDPLMDSGWTTFMNALQRAMPSIVNSTGVDTVEGIESSMRKAQDVMSREAGTPTPEHFDGVFAETERKQAAATLDEAQRMVEVYLSTFLDEADVGPMRWVQDSRFSTDPGDNAFARLNGSFGGMSIWQARMDQTIWRMVDIRSLFDTAEHAAAYEQERLEILSEGYPAVPEAPTVGEECFVYGGTTSTEVSRVTLTMTTYCYIFRVGRVVTKLFVAQGQEAEVALTPELVLPLAQRIVERIRTAGLAD